MDLTQGTARESIAPEEVAALRRAGALIEDPRRERPRYFDGRFLAARDLIRDQQYFLTREADLGQAAGSGVADGLWVGMGDGAHSITIAAGHGVTPAGELVLLEQPLAVRLADIPQAEQLSAKFGLGQIPQPPLRSRTGLFVLALRPVEFSANPMGAYPASVTGQRTVEDGDIVEATAVVLVPWQDDGASDALDARRGRAARAIFAQGVERGVSANVLPLAMIALQGNTVAWIDAPMVRRELGADRADLPGLGFAPRGLRLAHLMQYQGHLADVMRSANSRAFPASSWFPALPPAGPLPAGIINPADFTQSFLPAEIDVDFSIIPEDELPALVEEALSLPPIDLTAPADTLDSIAIMILAPVPRHEWRAVVARLSSLTRAVRISAPNLVSQRKPLEILQKLRLPFVAAPPLDPTNPSDAEWARLARLGSLWFVRRRNLSYRDDLAGVAVRFAGVGEVVDRAVRERIASLGLKPQLDSVLKRATPRAAAEVTSLLASPRFADSPALTAAALGGFSTATTLDHAGALTVAATLTAPGAGNGLMRLEQANSSLGATPAALKNIASGDWQALDLAARKAPGAAVPKLAATLVPGAKPRQAVAPVSTTKKTAAAAKPKAAATAKVAAAKKRKPK